MNKISNVLVKQLCNPTYMCVCVCVLFLLSAYFLFWKIEVGLCDNHAVCMSDMSPLSF
jgi:hypothetical protein